MKKLLSLIKKDALTLLFIGGVFLITSGLAFFFVDAAIKNNQKIAQERFESEIDSFIFLVEKHANAGLLALNGVRGFFSGSEGVTREEFYRYVETSGFLRDYPGFQSMGFAPFVQEESIPAFLETIRTDTSINGVGYPDFFPRPESDRGAILPIAYVYPEHELGVLMGLNSYGDPIRSDYADRARDLGEVVVSELIQLGEGGVGIIVAVPLYHTKEVPDSVERRREYFAGVVTTAIDMETFFGYVLPRSNVIRFGIETQITGNDAPVDVYQSPLTQGLWWRSHGQLKSQKKLQLTETIKYTFDFSVPVANLLTPIERMATLLLMGIFLFAALFTVGIFFVVQRTRTLKDFRRRYAFISTLAHQLRTPLTAIKWMLEGDYLTKVDQARKNDLKQSVDLLYDIINRLLTYLDVTTNRKSRTRSLMGVETLYRRTEKTLLPEARTRIMRKGKKRVSANVEVFEEDVVKALWYLIDNALTYSPVDTKVFVEVRLDQPWVEFRVEDTGYGIPKKEQDQVFNEFFRASNASLGKNAGSGVSLFIAKTLIEKHGGVIRFTSQEDQGSVFIIRLPVKK